MGQLDKTLVIGFGHEAKQGKDTLVNHLIEQFAGEELQPDGKWRRFLPINMKRYAFADPLKVELFDYIQAATFFTLQEGIWVNDGPNVHKEYSYQEKLDFINLHKDKLRPYLQLWGTEYRRRQSEEYWVKQIALKIKEDNPRAALVSDMRFFNEANFVDVTVNVVREGFKDEKSATHVSEQEGQRIDYDYRIQAQSVEELNARGEKLFERILKDRGLLPHSLPAIEGFPVWR